MLRVSRCVLGSAMALGVLAGMTSCHPSLRGNLSLSVNDRGQTLVGICDPGSIDHIYAYFGEDRTESGRKVLAAEGNSVAVTKGEVWGLDDEVPGFTVSLRERIHLQGGNTFSVLLLGAEESVGLRGDFEIPADGLQEGLWLFPDGSVSERVCGRYDDEHERIQERLGNASDVKK